MVVTNEQTRPGVRHPNQAILLAGTVRPIPGAALSEFAYGSGGCLTPPRYGDGDRDGDGTSDRRATVAERRSGINHHGPKALTASADGSFVYVGIGSNSNISGAA